MSRPSVTLILPGPLRKAAGAAQISVAGGTVGAAIAAAVAACPGLSGRIVDGAGRLRPFVKVFADGRPAALDTPLTEGAEVVIAPALAGG